MKKIIVFFISMMILFSISVLAEDTITVKVDDEVVNFDSYPQIIDGRTMVPVRAIFEKFDLNVMWNQETATVTAIGEEKKLIMKIGSNLIRKNDSYIIMDTTPVIINNRTYIPVRFVAEALGNYVVWNNDEKTVNIFSNIRNVTKIYKKYKNENISLLYPDGWFVDETYVKEGVVFIDNQGEKDVLSGMSMIMISEIEFSDFSFSDIVSTRYDYLITDTQTEVSVFNNATVNGLNATEFRYIDKEGDYVISYFIDGKEKVYNVSFISDKDEYFDDLCPIILDTFIIL